MNRTILRVLAIGALLVGTGCSRPATDTQPAPASTQGSGADPADAQATSATGPVDVILTGGKVITVDERFTIAQAIAVKGDRIVAVGSNDDISRAGRTGDAPDRPGRPRGRARHDRQPRALHGRRRAVDRRAAPRQRDDTGAGDRDDEGEGGIAAGGALGLHARRLVARSVHRRQEVVLARRAGSGRQHAPAAPAVHAGGNLREQQGDRGARPRSADRTVDQARRRRQVDRRHRRVDPGRVRRRERTDGEDPASDAAGRRAQQHGDDSRAECRRPDGVERHLSGRVRADLPRVGA